MLFPVPLFIVLIVSVMVQAGEEGLCLLEIMTLVERLELARLWGSCNRKAWGWGVGVCGVEGVPGSEKVGS